jgi:hypothetical protein
MLQTGSKVRLALPTDEAEIIALIAMMHAESGLFLLDEQRVRETLARAWDRKGGTLAVIGAPGKIRAMIYLTIATAWYTKESHLEELFCWVHPEHRRSDYAKRLGEFAKTSSDVLSDSAIKRGSRRIPLLIGVLTNARMTAKVRLYRRMFGMPVGAFFIYNATWMRKEESAEEDFWRLPKLVKMITRVPRRERRARA